MLALLCLITGGYIQPWITYLALSVYGLCLFWNTYLASTVDISSQLQR